MKKPRQIHIGRLAAVLAFLAAAGFFLFAYPYHLMRREQMNLFLFDGDYIRQTYRGVGWLACFLGDFLEQFFLLPVVGPLIIALLLTGIACVVYKICRRFLGRWPSLAVAALFFIWSFLRETGNLYITRYTVATLGYLVLALAALRFRRSWARPVAAVLLLAFGVWSLGLPVQKTYGKAWGVPRIAYDRVIGLDVEVSHENWDKVVRMSRQDLHMVESSYCYNLAHAMKGELGQTMLDYAQDHQYTLLFPVSADRSIFTNTLAGEAWFQLGDMTIAEQSAITCLQASPKHTGVRFLVRLARINLISGEDACAQKYLSLLSRTLFYGKWARSMMPGHQDEATRTALAEARTRLAGTDFVHESTEPERVLQGLLEADPDNDLARNYLLCYDLMCYDLDGFMEVYSQKMCPGHLYQEAILIWLSQRNEMTEQNAARYGVDKGTIGKMERFFINPRKYKNTYWSYYMAALQRSAE